MSRSPIRGITFDFWNTLVAETVSADHRADRWYSAMERQGRGMDRAVFDAALLEMWVWFQGEWELNRVVSPEAATERFARAAGVDDDAALTDEFLSSIHEGFDPSDMQIADGIGDALEALRSGGIRIGIICDVGITPSTTLRRYLDHHGLLDQFDHWSFSDDVGVYKPDVRIFDHALSGLEVGDGAAMAHIGDLRRTDVAGARRHGWLALRYSGLHDDQADLEDGHHVVADHRELPGLLGLT